MRPGGWSNFLPIAVFWVLFIPLMTLGMRETDGWLRGFVGLGAGTVAALVAAFVKRAVSGNREFLDLTQRPPRGQ